MVQRAATLLLLVLSVSLALLAESKPQPLPPMTAEAWRFDVEYLARELPKRHKNAFHTITREQFAAAVAALRAKAGQAKDDEMDDEMMVGLMRIAAMVGDGHTYVRLPSSLHQFLVTVVYIDGDHRVVRGAGSATELVGGKLIRIDDMPIEEAIARIRTVLPQAESEVLFAAFTPQWFSVAEVLHGLGITRSAAAARFTVALDDGSERSADVTALGIAATPQWRIATTNPPLYRQRQTEGFWFTWLPESRTVYVSFRKYDDLRAKSRELWAFVDSHPVQKIAIDLRQNGGGDFNVGRKYLVDELARRPKLHAYVITGGRTFSAALKNAIDFREISHATLVGETIGERPNSYSENDELTLPSSRIQVSYSTRYYKFLPDDDKLVTPDQEIRPTWADWVAGRDPVLDWILQDQARPPRARP
jgi:hypothetical protein